MPPLSENCLSSALASCWPSPRQCGASSCAAGAGRRL